MTDKEILEKEQLEKKLRNDTLVLRYLELYILDNAENIKSRIILEGANPEREAYKIQAIGELRKILSEEPEEMENEI